jgi:hypothetical protein
VGQEIARQDRSPLEGRGRLPPDGNGNQSCIQEKHATGRPHSPKDPANPSAFPIQSGPAAGREQGVGRGDRFIPDFGRSSADFAVRRNGIARKYREGIMGANSCGKPDPSTIIKRKLQ